VWLPIYATAVTGGAACVKKRGRWEKGGEGGGKRKENKGEKERDPGCASWCHDVKKN